jgi:hypothetical protein
MSWILAINIFLELLSTLVLFLNSYIIIKDIIIN